MASVIGRLRSTIRREDGAELIEFALVFPILLLVVAGIVDFGFLFQRYEVVTNAAREGARLAVLPNYTDTDVRDRIGNYLTSAGLTAAYPVPSVTASTETLSSGATVPVVTVIVEYHSPFTFIGPIAAMVGGSGWTSITLRAASVMRVEGGAGAGS